jgi:hypothetical protein
MQWNGFYRCGAYKSELGIYTVEVVFGMYRT